MTETRTATKSRDVQGGPEATRGGAYFTPRVDIYETEKELLLIADVPGVKSEDIDLRFDRGELILHARVQPRPRQGNPLLREYDVGDFYRVFQVHESVDGSKIAATCKNGVLTLHLPKTAAAQPRQIKVSGGESP